MRILRKIALLLVVVMLPIATYKVMTYTKGLESKDYIDSVIDELSTTDNTDKEEASILNGDYKGLVEDVKQSVQSATDNLKELKKDVNLDGLVNFDSVGNLLNVSTDMISDKVSKLGSTVKKVSEDGLEQIINKKDELFSNNDIYQNSIDTVKSKLESFTDTLNQITSK